VAEWQTANLSFNALEPILAAVAALEGAGKAREAVTDAIATALDVLAAIQQGIDVQAAIVDAAFAAVIAALDELAADSAGHLLFVPPIPPFARIPDTPRIPMQALENLAFLRMVNRVSAELEGDGGNYGLYRKFVESLFDRGDFSKPTYSPNAFIGGGILLFGADSFASIVQGMLSLSGLFSGILQLPVDNYQLPVPQNVKARPVAATNRSALNGFQVISAGYTGDAPLDTQGFIPILSRPTLPEFVSAKVHWDAPKTVVFDVNFGPLTYTIVSWHVYVKPHEKITAGEDVSQYEVASYNVTPRKLTRAEQSEIGTAPVLGNVNGVILQKLRPGTTYYISVAYTTDMEERGQLTVPIVPSWETLSGQIRFRGEDRLGYTNFVEGTPPDWMAISSPMAAFPPVRQALLEVKATVELYRTALGDRSNALSAAADGLRNILAGISLQQGRLERAIEQFLGTLENISIGVWTTTFSGQGGNPFLVNAVGDLLLNPETVNRPEFDQGDEALSALFFVTGSETAGEVDAFVTLLSLFLGAPGGGFNVLSDIEQTAASSDPVYLDAGANPTTEENAVNADAANAAASGTTDDTETRKTPLSELGVGKDDC
jgi:hypothetical protein